MIDVPNLDGYARQSGCCEVLASRARSLACVTTTSPWLSSTATSSKELRRFDRSLLLYPSFAFPSCVGLSPRSVAIGASLTFLEVAYCTCCSSPLCNARTRRSLVVYRHSGAGCL